MAEDRFVRIYSKGVMSSNEVIVDRVTGVNYLFHQSGYGGGLCPLIDADGKPIVTDSYTLEHDIDRK